MSADLFEEHKAIVEAAENFLAMVKRQPRPSLEEVSRLRVRLSSLIRHHRTTEEEFIFGPLTRKGGIGSFPQLEPLMQDLMREKVKYSEHIRKWTPQAIEADWHGYVAACEQRVAAVKRVIDQEEAGIYQIVLGDAQTHRPIRARP